MIITKGKLQTARQLSLEAITENGTTKSTNYKVNSPATYAEKIRQQGSDTSPGSRSMKD